MSKKAGDLGANWTAELVGRALWAVAATEFKLSVKLSSSEKPVDSVQRRLKRVKSASGERPRRASRSVGSLPLNEKIDIKSESKQLKKHEFLA